MEETVSYAFEEARTESLMAARKRIEELEKELMETRVLIQDLRAQLIVALCKCETVQISHSGAV